MAARMPHELQMEATDRSALDVEDDMVCEKMAMKTKMYTCIFHSECVLLMSDRTRNSEIRSAFFSGTMGASTSDDGPVSSRTRGALRKKAVQAFHEWCIHKDPPKYLDCKKVEELDTKNPYDVRVSRYFNGVYRVCPNPLNEALAKRCEDYLRQGMYAYVEYFYLTRAMLEDPELLKDRY